MDKALRRISAAILALSMLLSVSVFAADVNVNYVLRANGDDAAAQDQETHNWVVRNKGDAVDVDVYVTPDATGQGGGEVAVYYDEDFFELASGNAGYSAANRDYTLDKNTSRLIVSGYALLDNGVQKYFKFMCATADNTAGAERYVGTLRFKVKTNTKNTEGWIHLFPGQNIKTESGADYYVGPSFKVGSTSCKGEGGGLTVKDLLVTLPCTVTFDADGGSPTPPVQTVSGTATEPTTPPTKDGFTFGGWQLDGKPYDFSTPVTKNITLTAAWTPNAPVTYQVTFNTDGGTPTPPVQTVNKGDVAKEPTTLPTRDGYDFGGWQLDGKPYDFKTPVTENITLTAAWTPKPVMYKVEFDPLGGSPAPASQTVESGKTATEPRTQPTKKDYTFGGWQLDGKPYDFKTPVTKDVTLTAAWNPTAPVTHRVTFDPAGGTPTPPVQTVNQGGAATEPTTPPTKDGYDFGGWQLDGKPYDFKTPVTKDVTLTAKWTPKPVYTVTCEKPTDGTLTSDKATAPKDAKVTLTAKPNSGKKLSGAPTVKMADGTSVPVTRVNDTTYTFMMPAGNVTATAAFVADSSSGGGGGGGGTTPTTPTTDVYSVNVTPANGGSVTANPASRIPAGTMVTLTPEPDDGAKGVGRMDVTGPDGTSIPTERKSDGTYTFAMPKGNVTVRATFETKVASPDDTGVSQLLNTDDHIWYLRGYVEGDIRPLGNMTRAEAAQAFYRLLRRPEVTLTKSFPDVPDGAWYTKAVRTLASMGSKKGRRSHTPSLN